MGEKEKEGFMQQLGTHTTYNAEYIRDIQQSIYTEEDSLFSFTISLDSSRVAARFRTYQMCVLCFAGVCIHCLAYIVSMPLPYPTYAF